MYDNPRIQGGATGIYFADRNADNIYVAPVNKVRDADWVSNTFMSKGINLSETDKTNRFWTQAKLKFTDTSIGGNIGVNCKPQYTRYCDIRAKGRRDRNEVTVPSVSGNYGMGDYYSEAIDDNAMTLFLEFGVPEFNSLFTFFSRSIDYGTSVMANTGRSTIAYTAGNLLGAAVMFVAFPMASIAVYGIKFVSSLMSNDAPFSYYYLKPAMHTFWSAVNSITNMFAVEEGIVIPEFMNDGTKADRIGVPLKINQTDMDYLRTLMPDLITNNNYIDTFAVATKAQRLANEQILKERDLFESGELSNTDMEGFVTTPITKWEKNSPGEDSSVNILNAMFSFNRRPNKNASTSKVQSFEKYLKEIKTKAASEYGKEEKPVESTVKSSTKNTEDKRAFKEQEDGTFFKTILEKGEEKFDAFTANFDAAVRGGGQYAIFKVDYVGSVTDSFSNSITEIPTNGILKSLTKKSMDVKFSLAGGNVVDGVGTAVGYAKDLVAGTLESLTFGLSNILPSLLGNGYITMDKMWEDSSYSFPSVNYTFRLQTPYNHPVSRLKSIYIPMSMILAGALPLETGKAGYTSPLLCKSFLKGVQSIDKGMITEVSITRAVSNLGYDRHNKALAFDISFKITDFSSLMTVPVNSSIFSGFKLAMNDGSMLSKFVSTITARDLMTSKYAIPKAKIKLSRAMFQIDAMTSPAFWGIRAGNMMDGILGSAVSPISLNLTHNNI